MKIAVITDVHANAVALQATLDAIQAMEPDAIYHTGDAIAIGPYPAETLDLLLNAPDMRFVMGNHDRVLREFDRRQVPERDFIRKAFFAA